MKKTVSVAEFTRRFGPTTAVLRPGESVEVTRFGKLHGRYVRAGLPRRARQLDLGNCLARQGYSQEDGKRLISAILATA